MSLLSWHRTVETLCCSQSTKISSKICCKKALQQRKRSILGDHNHFQFSFFVLFCRWKVEHNLEKSTLKRHLLRSWNKISYLRIHYGTLCPSNECSKIWTTFVKLSWVVSALFNWQETKCILSMALNEILERDICLKICHMTQHAHQMREVKSEKARALSYGGICNH